MCARAHARACSLMREQGREKFFSREGFSVALEPILELALVNQADFELTRSACLCLLSAGIKGMHYHCPAVCVNLIVQSREEVYGMRANRDHQE